MSYDSRYQRTTTNRPGARRYYAPPPGASRGNASHHSFFGYWVPLVVTGTIAIGGLAAWIWSERSEHDEDDHPQSKPPRPQSGAGQPYSPQGSQPYPGPPPSGGQQGYGPPPGQSGPPPPPPGGQQGYGPPPGQSGPPPPPPPGGEASSYYNASSDTRDVNAQYSQQDGSTWYGRMAGVVKRTPSPQQVFDTATKGVTAGMAAAGAALGSIMEGGSDEEYDERRQSSRTRERRSRTEERDGFSDHERWSEEAEEKQRVSAVEAESERRAKVARNVRDEKGKDRAKRAVAVVVSADAVTLEADSNAGYTTEHASILSHLPSEHNSDTVDLFVLIYAPGMKTLPPLNYQPRTGSQQVTSTVGSSYSQISTPAVTPGSELQSMSPRVDAVDAPTKQFDALYSQALALVSDPTHILPFTTSDGYVHILRHLAPQVVYVSDVLSGDEGDNIAQLKGWVGHTILVAGDDGVGGLADTETEDERPEERRETKRRWYDESSFVGLGKDVEVIDAIRVGDDFGRRVDARD